MSHLAHGGGYIPANDLRPNHVVRFEGSNEPVTVLEVRHDESPGTSSGYVTTATLRLGDDEFEAELDPTDTLRLVPAREARALDAFERLERRTRGN